jgi:hypothetical protein
MIGRRIIVIAAVASLLLSGCMGVNGWEAKRRIGLDNRDVNLDASAHYFNVTGKQAFRINEIKIGAERYGGRYYLLLYRNVQPGNGDVVEMNEEWVSVKHDFDECRLEISVLPNDTGVARDAYIRCTCGDYGDRVAIHQSAE